MKKMTGILLLFLSFNFGCGVKGDPIPPSMPPELGRGEPTYKRATEEFAFPDVPAIHEEPKKDRTNE
jgi:hypothetical protein